VRAFLKQHKLPVVSTFQAAGVVSKELEDCFVGRVGLFKNQPGDKLIDQSDLIITIGFDPVEYDAEIWNPKADKTIIHIDHVIPRYHTSYYPVVELFGDISETLMALSPKISGDKDLSNISEVKEQHDALYDVIKQGKTLSGERVHPLRFIYELQEFIDESYYVLCDVGSIYMWMLRYFLSYEPRHLLSSNGQQTLGVGLPWAITTSLLHPDNKVISMSGDGGFLFSAMELETAVREKVNFVHFIWNDNCFDMVKEQQLMKYQRSTAVDFINIDHVKFAESFGATGIQINHSDELAEVIKSSLSMKGPVIVDVPID